MPAVGLDLSDNTVKCAELLPTREGLRLGRFGEAKLPEGCIAEGRVKEAGTLTQAIEEFAAEHRLQFVHGSLPAEHAYQFQTELPADTPSAELATAVEFSLKENVPLPPEELLYDFTLLTAPTRKKPIAAVSVYPIEIVESYTAICKDAGIQPLSFETEAQADARALVGKSNYETVMIVDIGRTGSELSIVSQGTPLFISSLEIAGNDITNVVKRFMQVSFAEAEQVKEERGFIKSEENNDLFEALLGPISDLRDEITKHLTYWHMHGSSQHHLATPDVDHILLTGGGANLRGLVDYLNATMSLPVYTGNVWTNVDTFDNYIPPLPRAEALTYATALGLALRPHTN
jgi:type IV pilus assembly protein PilM